MAITLGIVMAIATGLRAGSWLIAIGGIILVVLLSGAVPWAVTQDDRKASGSKPKHE